MTNTLSRSFLAGNGRKIKWQGTTVHSLLQLQVKEGDMVTVTRISSSKTRAQAIKIAVDKGDLRANGVLVPTAAIWTHTSPEHAHLEVVGRRARAIDVWNSWSSDGVDSAWLGNAGMVVESQGQVHTLRCSDGLGEVTFDDLVVALEITSHG